MNIAFLTEMGFEGKVPSNHSNMRTEFAWMLALNADHRYIRHYQEVKNYDHVFIIFPKGEVYLNSVGSKLIDKKNPVSDLLKSDLITSLKSTNKNVHYVQEGPHWLWNDYEIEDQIYFYNMLSQCDSIFAHNNQDVEYYSGLFPNKKVRTIQTLMIDNIIKDINPTKEEKTIIGGNFARWYGGFESYIVAQQFGLSIWAQDSHAKRENEDLIEGINHLPRLLWIDWMIQLSKFKYAVHLMPTVAAGTFSLNCAYFGIPCIGNIDVDTQFTCHPRLSVNCNNLHEAVNLAIELKNNKDFYESCSKEAKENYIKYYNIEVWKDNIIKKLVDETK